MSKIEEWPPATFEVWFRYHAHPKPDIVATWLYELHILGQSTDFKTKKPFNEAVAILGGLECVDDLRTYEVMWKRFRAWRKARRKDARKRGFVVR